MSSTKRSPARQGIESRTDAKGREQHRGYVTVDKATGRKRRGPWTSSLAEARSWRIDALAALQAGTLSGERGPTVREAVSGFVAGIESGAILNRSGKRFKPSVVRGYRRDLEQRVVPAIGATRLNEVRLPDVQRLIDLLSAKGLSGSSVRNATMALRSLYGWARPRGYAQQNPCDGLRLPSGSRRRERIASADECALLSAALPSADRPAFALACYAGLRAGEVLALDWTAVDLDAHVLRVERGWDLGSGEFIEPKSKAAARVVPITKRLHAILLDHQEATGGTGLLFPARGRAERPMSHSALIKRMAKRWRKFDMEPLGLHEARHTFASLLIDAGANAKAISTYMGHASISITFDRYGHLMPGSEAEVRGLLDAYLSGTA